MSFAAIFIPDFIVQAITRGEPALRGRAVAIVQGVAPVWSVVSANPAALNAGIIVGMTKSQAEQFTTTEIRHRSAAQEKAAHEALLDLGWSMSPRVEDNAADTIVVDLAGLGGLLGSDEKIAEELRRRSVNLGLSPNIAVAKNLEVAILAARGFSKITLIASGEEAARLSTLPVETLLPSVETLATFTRWGISTCGALAALPVIQLSERMGQEGVRLHSLARGAFERSMVLARPSVFFQEEMELDDAVVELESLSFVLGRLLDQLCERLAARSLAARVIAMEFELERSFEKELQVATHPGQQKLIPRLFEKKLALPVPMRDSKLLLKLVRLRLQSDSPPAAVVKIVMSAEADRPRTTQRGLFQPAAPELEKLELTMARLANVVGDGNVGSPQLIDTHRPDVVRMERFRVVQEATAGNRRRKGDARSSAVATRNSQASQIDKPACGFRFFRPGVPARVELCDGLPSRVSFQGLRGDVVAASGPWRTSGEWWKEAWDQAEWDVEVEFASPNAKTTKRSNNSSNSSNAVAAINGKSAPRLAYSRNINSTAKAAPARGLYLIYYDAKEQNWFLRGTYD
jgi:protein ImuB